MGLLKRLFGIETGQGKNTSGPETQRVSPVECFNDLHKLVVQDRDWSMFAKVVAHKAFVPSYLIAVPEHEEIIKALREAGDVVVDLLIEELESDPLWPEHVAEVLATIGNPKALPAVRRSLDRNQFQDSDVDAFLKAHRTEQEIARDEANAATEKKRHDALCAKFRNSTDAQMLRYLQKLCKAYSESNRREIERLEPIATVIGEELNRRGGLEEMQAMWELLGHQHGARTLEMHWNGIAEWLG